MPFMLPLLAASVAAPLISDLASSFFNMFNAKKQQSPEEAGGWLESLVKGTNLENNSMMKGIIDTLNMGGTLTAQQNQFLQQNADILGGFMQNQPSTPAARP